MSITGILIAAACVGIVGIFVGLFLGVAGIKFKVEVDEKEEAVLAALPGNNCGGCGFAGCSGLAAAIAKGEAAVNTCPVGGEEVGKKLLRSWEWRLELPNVRWRMFTARETAIGRRRIMIITASRTAA